MLNFEIFMITQCTTKGIAKLNNFEYKWLSPPNNDITASIKMLLMSALQILHTQRLRWFSLASTLCFFNHVVL